MKSIILIISLALSGFALADGPSELLLTARSNMDSGLVGKWCMENTELEYAHDMTLTSAGRLFAFTTMKETKEIDPAVGTWSADGAQITVQFDNELEGPKPFSYELESNGKLKIDLKDGDAIRVYSHCEFLGM